MIPGTSPDIRILRLVLEAKTPLSVTTGRSDGIHDTTLVTDANGLPAIPGTTIAGVLRQLWRVTHGEADARSVFGHQDGDEGRASRLGVSWGALLDSRGCAVEGLCLGNAADHLQRDPLLKVAVESQEHPQVRERVRLNHKGAAAGEGKFDRAVVPAGYRFAVELVLGDADEATRGRLLALLGHPGLRMGGATRAGLGRMRCVACHEGRFDLRDPEAAARLRDLPPDLSDCTGLTDVSADIGRGAGAADWLADTLVLHPRGYWRIGGGKAPSDDKAAEKPADLLPVLEPRVEWSARGGALRDATVVLPGSSLKGALAHRFVFHACRLAGFWADGAQEPTVPAGIREALFGSIKASDIDAGTAEGRAGCLYVDDAWMNLEAAYIERLMHNAIDRFTGGVRDRVLFSEECISPAPPASGDETALDASDDRALSVDIALDRGRLEEACAAENVAMADVCAALRLALADLQGGRLALGGRTTTGNGFFTGTLTGGTLQPWLYADATATEVA